MAWSAKIQTSTNVPYELEAANANALYGISGTTYTLGLAEVGKELQTQSGSATTITVPTNGTAAFVIGTVFTGHQYGAGQVTFTPFDGTVTIRTAFNVARTTRAQYSVFAIRKIATNEWLLYGDLTP